MNNIQVQTAFKVTDIQYCSEQTRLHTELELQSGDLMSTLNTTVKNCEGK